MYRALVQPRPSPLQTLIDLIPWLSVEEQRAQHLRLVGRMLEAATVRQVRSIQRNAVTCPLCEWLGDAHRETVENLIEGHLALRTMKLVRRRRRRSLS